MLKSMNPQGLLSLYLLGLDRHASAVNVSEQDVTCIHYTFIILMAVYAATNVITSILPDNGLWPKSLTVKRS